MIHPAIFGTLGRKVGSEPLTLPPVAELLLWLRSDTGLFQDIAKTTPASSDGDLIGSWDDQSEYGKNFSAASASPTYKTNILNGHPVVRFNGTTRMVAAGSDLYTMLSDKDSYSIIAVLANWTWRSNYHHYQVGGVFACQPLGAYLTGIGIGSDSIVSGAFFNPGAHITVGKSGISAGAPIIVEAINTDGSLTIFVNNAQGTTNPATGTLTYGASEMMVGRNGDNHYYVGDIAELAVFDKGLTPEERASVDAYFAEKYAITLA